MDEPNLHDYIIALRRRWRIVALAVLAGVGVALAVSLVQTPRYRAEVEMLLQRSPSERILIDDLGQVQAAGEAERDLNNEIRHIESGEVREAVDQVYDGPLDVADVEAVAPSSETADVIELSVSGEDASGAAELVNLYAERYIAVRRQQQVEDLLATGNEIQAQLDGLAAEVDEVSRPITELDRQIAETTDPQERASLEAERVATARRVRPRLASLEARESSYRTQLEQVQVSVDLARSGGIQVLTAAEEPSTPVSPNLARNLLVGGLIGLLGGIALAYLVDYFDDSVGSKEESERVTGLPTLGMVPKQGGRRGEQADLVSLEEPASSAAESYRSLRTSVKFLGVDSPVGTILVTSAAASEGKTMTAVNLAVVLAQAGERVLLVDADLRRRRAHQVLGTPHSPGLTNVLLGDAGIAEAVRTLDELPGLHVLPPGPPPPNPAELLDGSRARQLFEALAGTYDTVVIDTAPVLPVTDALVLSRVADAVLLVVAYGDTSKRGLARTRELLGQVDAPVVGSVLNLVPADQSYGGYDYRYHASHRRRAWRRGTGRSRRDGGGPTLTTRPVGGSDGEASPSPSAPAPVPPPPPPPPPPSADGGSLEQVGYGGPGDQPR